MVRKLKVGVIGGGLSSEVGKIHISSMLIDNLWEINAAVFSLDRKENKNTAKYYNLDKCKLYENHKSLLRNEKNNLDLVVLLTPIFHHYKTLTDIMKTNLPIISEKSLVSSMKEIESLKKKNKKNQIILTTFNYSGYLAIKDIKKKIARKKIEKINKIIINYPIDSFISQNSSPKKRRLSDKLIPTFMLDLGPHIHQIIYYISNLLPTKVMANIKRYGKFKNVYDDCSCLVEFGKNVDGIIWMSKSATGFKKGLSLKLIGTKGSIIWNHENPETYFLYQKNNIINKIERSSFSTSLLKRYSRFKPGHPEGFLEAFSNIYKDFNQIIASSKTNKKINYKYYDTDSVTSGLNFLNAISKSAKEKKWIKIR